MRIVIYFLTACFVLSGCVTVLGPPDSNTPTDAPKDLKDAAAPNALPGPGALEDPNKKEMPNVESLKTAEPTVPADTELDSLYKRFIEAKQARQFKAATDIAGQILARNPNDIKVFNALAVMSIDHGKYELARMFLDKILTKEPGNSAALNNLGVIELKTDNLRLALVQFKKAIGSDSRNKAAHANLGSICLQYRNFQCASTELMAAYDNGDQGTDTLNNLGFALAGAGHYDQAESYYDKAGAKNSSNVTVLLNYAVLLIEHANRPQDGIKVLNKLRFVAHEPAILEKVDYLAKKAEGKNPTPKDAPID